MTVYRFRFKYDPEPLELWRDIHIGADRTLEELHSIINEAFGLGEGNRWFIGDGESYWNSDITYLSPQDDQMQADADNTRNAAETTVGELAQQLGIEQYERICYLYDYGDEWRFYAICKEVYDGPADTKPSVGKQKGDPLEQYPEPETLKTLLPEPLETLTETPVSTADLEAIEAHDAVECVINLLTVETDAGMASERFVIQYDDVGYLLELYPEGWEIVEQIEATDNTNSELLEELVSRVRTYHTKLAELAAAALGEKFDDETVKAMNAELNRELEARGLGHL